MRNKMNYIKVAMRLQTINSLKIFQLVKIKILILIFNKLKKIHNKKKI